MRGLSGVLDSRASFLALGRRDAGDACCCCCCCCCDGLDDEECALAFFFFFFLLLDDDDDDDFVGALATDPVVVDDIGLRDELMER